jgi:predicted site-specific integrase-resolvase
MAKAEITRGNVDYSSAIPAGRLRKEHKAAEILDVSVKTLRRWRWAGRGPAWRKIGAAVRYADADLAAFIEGAKRGGAA